MDYYYDGEEAETKPKSKPWWSSAICGLAGSRNLLAVAFRTYMDFTTYYVTLFVVAVNTVIMMVLSKHLWRAFWIKEEK